MPARSGLMILFILIILAGVMLMMLHSYRATP
jgi:hypothetical protein